MGNDSRYRMTYGSTETEPPVEHYELRRAVGAPYARLWRQQRARAVRAYGAPKLAQGASLVES